MFFMSSSFWDSEHICTQMCPRAVTEYGDILPNGPIQIRTRTGGAPVMSSFFKKKFFIYFFERKTCQKSELTRRSERLINNYNRNIYIYSVCFTCCLSY